MYEHNTALLDTAQKCAALSTNPIVEVRLNLAVFSIDAFKQTIYSSLTILTDKELSDLVSASYIMVLNHIVQSKDSQLVTFLFGSSRYVTMLLSTLSSEKGNIDPATKSNLNKIMYDYFELGEPDSVVEQLLLSIINLINRDLVTRLIVAGVTGEDAAYLALDYSSANGNYNLSVARINKYIIFNFDPEEINEQKIADIYLTFFSDKFTAAFIAVMVDSYANTTTVLTPEQYEIYSTISNAILGILEYMPQASIANIIGRYSKDFYGYYKVVNPKLEARVKLTSLSNDYPSINTVVHEILRFTILVP